MELADFELRAELFLGAVAQLENLQLPDLERERLSRPDDVAVGLGLDLHLVDRRVVAEKLHDLVARPLLVVQSGVDHQPDRAQHFVIQSSIVAVRIVVVADFLPQPLRIERPPFDEGGVAALLPELRQVGQLLLNRELHVMSGDAFVIRRRLGRQRLARRGLVRVHVHAPGTRAVRRAGLVRRAGGLFLAERLHRHDLDLRFRQPSQELRQTRVHLVDEVRVAVDDVLRRLEVQIGILFDRGVERLQIVEALALGDLQHVRFDARHFVEADLVNLLGREIAGGLLLHAEGVARLAVGQRPDADVRPPLRRVFVAHERLEFLVRRNDGVLDGLERGLADALLVGVGDAVRKLRERQRERRFVGRRVADVGGLAGDFVEQELRRHQLRGHAFAHVGDGVVEGHRELAAADDVVVVVLHSLEGQRRRQLRRAEVKAAHLIDGRLPAVELRPFDALRRIAHHQIAIEPLLFAEAGGVDRFEALQEPPGLFEIGAHRGLGDIADLVVASLVAEDRRGLRIRPHRVFPLLVEEIVESLAAAIEIGGGELLGAQRIRGQEEQEDRQQLLHRRSIESRAMKRAGWALVIFSFLTVALHAQVDPDLLAGLKARSIGPASMSGRVAAIDVVESNPDIVYFCAGTGGLWKSTKGGLSFAPVFDDQPVAAIGAVAIYQASPEIVWVGTGEGNVRNSMSVGNGVYKSMDGGKTWQHLGLDKTERIYRIVLHPRDPNIAWVAAMGQAWGQNPERGVFKTTDGGTTWTNVLYSNERSGAAELVIDPANPNKLFASLWEYRRWPWFFNSGGPGSGLYVTYDGGANWKRYTEEDGIPKGTLGRVGIAIAHSNPNIVYALVEAEKSALLRSDDGGLKWTA